MPNGLEEQNKTAPASQPASQLFSSMMIVVPIAAISPMFPF